MTRILLILVSALIGWAHSFSEVDAAGPPTIRIDSVTPDGPWSPGDSLKITMNVTYTEAPFPGRVDFQVREVTDAGVKQTNGPSLSIDFDQRNATRILAMHFYNVPNRSCMVFGSTTTPVCSFPATFAETLTKLNKIELVARLLDGDGREVVIATREIDVSYPEIASLSVQSQPLMSERPLRVVVNGAKFTEADSINLAFRKVGAPTQGFFPVVWGNPTFNRACTPPRGGAEGLAYCDAKIVNDTTIEFMLRTFRSSISVGSLEPDSSLEQFTGNYDLHVHWTPKPPPPEGFNFRAPDAVLLGAYALTAPVKDDFVEIKKITLTQTFPEKTEVFEPGKSTTFTFAANATVNATVEFDYRLSRRLGCRISFVIRKQGQAAPLIVRAGNFWNTVGQVIQTDGTDPTENPPRQQPFRLGFSIPADEAGLEFSLVMTDIQGRYDREETVFTRSEPLVLSRDTLKLADVTSDPTFPIKVESERSFHAKVTYQVTSRNDADLALRLFDEKGVLQGSSDFIRVQKSDTEQTIENITIPSVLITTNAQGVYPAKLILRAVLIDRLRQEVFAASSDIEYALGPKASLVGLEVVQVIQDWNNSIPLIAGKATYVRAHFVPTDNDDLDVTKAKLHGFVGQDELSAEPLTPLNDDGRVFLDALDQPAQRKRWSHSMNFRLPDNWTQGELRLVFEAPGVACKESAGTPNDCSVTVTFQPASLLLVKFVNIEWTDENNVTYGEADESEVDEEARKVFNMLPIAAFKKGRDYTTGFMRMSGTQPINLSTVLEELRAYQKRDSESPTFNAGRIYYGVIKDLPALTTGGTVGLGEGGGDVSAGGVVLGADGRTTAVHELAHNLRQRHPIDASLPLIEKEGEMLKQGPCKEEDWTDAESFPYLESVHGDIRPTLGPMTAGDDALVYGLNSEAATRDGNDAIVNPFDQFELMSYCDPVGVARSSPESWPSKFTYTNLIDEVSSRAVRSPTGLLAVNQKRDFLLVAGSIHLKQQTAEFRPFGRLTTAAPPSDPPLGPYTLQLRNASGAVLAAVNFEPSIPGPERGFTPQRGSFLIAVPANAAYQQAAILRQGVVIGSLNASANPPTVEVLFPNGGENLEADKLTLHWRGTDPDGDALSYVIQFSPDGGVSWETLGVNWTQESYDISQRYLQGTGNGLFRVTASDGFNTASDVSNATFSLPNRAPTVVIRSPTLNYFFTGSQQVVFEATASDREDGAIDGANLEWRSSLDGLLGAGSVIQRPATSLKEGSHVITTTATDAGGVIATSIVNIAVMRIAPTNLSDLAITRLAVPTTASLGDNVSFVATIANHGPNDASGVKVTNTLPAGVSFVGATLTQGTFAQSDQTVVGTLANLAAGAEVTMTINGRTGVAGTGSFTTSVTGAVVDPNPGNNVATTSITVQPPRLVVSVTSTQLVLSWPAPAAGFSLESATSLTPPINWAPVTTPITPAGDRNTVTVSLAAAARFYRLVKP